MLARNPNYHGDRPHRFARIELTMRVPAARAVHEIESGTADYTQLGRGLLRVHARDQRPRAHSWPPGMAPAAPQPPAVRTNIS